MEAHMQWQNEAERYITGGQEDDQYNHGLHWMPNKPAMDHVLPICGILVEQVSKGRPKLEILP